MSRRWPAYGIRGVLWCQGEGNRDYPVTYRKLLTTLIAEWRQLWGCGDFPFLIVQLANYGERKAEPWEGKDCAIREVQLQDGPGRPPLRLIVAIDLGLAKDVHYPNKKTHRRSGGPGGPGIGLWREDRVFGPAVPVG